MAEDPAAPSENAETAQLLARARQGDRNALDTLFAQELQRLRRFASGRLPRWARDIVDTSDLIQDTLLQSFKHLNTFEPRGEGALQAYLRQALVNKLRNQLRRVLSRPQMSELDSEWQDDGTSPLEATIGREALGRYEGALSRLTPDQRDAIISRVEFGMTYAEIAVALEKPSADAARMTVVRALERLTQEMARERVGDGRLKDGDDVRFS